MPRIVFTSAMAGVVPACHETQRPPEVIVLAVQGFAGSATAPSASASATRSAAAPPSTALTPPTASVAPPPIEPQVIVLAVQGFRGKPQDRKAP